MFSPSGGVMRASYLTRFQFVFKGVGMRNEPFPRAGDDSVPHSAGRD